MIRTRPLVRSNQFVGLVVGVQDHQPYWAGVDCPWCGSAPCGPHPDILACEVCGDEWPCDTIRAVAASLKALSRSPEPELQVASYTLRKSAAALLRGVVLRRNQGGVYDDQGADRLP